MFTRIIAQTAERRPTHPHGAHNHPCLCVEDHQVTLGRPTGQGHAERMEAQGHTLVRHLKSEHTFVGKSLKC